MTQTNIPILDNLAGHLLVIFPLHSNKHSIYIQLRCLHNAHIPSVGKSDISRDCNKKLKQAAEMKHKLIMSAFTLIPTLARYTVKLSKD